MPVATTPGPGDGDPACRGLGDAANVGAPELDVAPVDVAPVDVAPIVTLGEPPGNGTGPVEGGGTRTPVASTAPTAAAANSTIAAAAELLRMTIRGMRNRSLAAPEARPVNRVLVR